MYILHRKRNHSSSVLVPKTHGRSGIGSILPHCLAPSLSNFGRWWYPPLCNVAGNSPSMELSSWETHGKIARIFGHRPWPIRPIGPLTHSSADPGWLFRKHDGQYGEIPFLGVSWEVENGHGSSLVPTGGKRKNLASHLQVQLSHCESSKSLWCQIEKPSALRFCEVRPKTGSLRQSPVLPLWALRRLDATNRDGFSLDSSFGIAISCFSCFFTVIRTKNNYRPDIQT